MRITAHGLREAVSPAGNAGLLKTLKIVLGCNAGSDTEKMHLTVQPVRAANLR